MIYLIDFENNKITYSPFLTRNSIKKYLQELQKENEDISSFLIIEGEKISIEDIIK